MCYPKRSETQAAIEKIKAEISDLQRESQKLDQTVEVRNCAPHCGCNHFTHHGTGHVV